MQYIKLVILLKRRPDLSFEEFQQYYEEHHAELARHFPEQAYYVRRYLRPLPGADPADAFEPEFDVITEIWHSSEADFQRTMERMAEPGLAQTIHEDEDRLFDRSAMRAYLVEEHHSDFIAARAALHSPSS